jgi:GNAT superfamily N-acetyltransferase
VTVEQITLSETYPVRRAVLYPDGPEAKIHVPSDDEGTHFGAWMRRREGDRPASENEIVVTISLFREPLPLHLTPPFSSYNPVQTLRFRKFACLKQHQGHGFGAKVLQHVFDFAKLDPELGPGSVVWCDARRSTQEWYLRRGMRTIGEVFLKGDIEYIVMGIQV